ncbi:MAG: DUF4190 domain-containing protein [Verrucomicrobia bacterium]|nr:MAG: DUF4190 domain-containing protein [Verrucomicrobiota bacterium]
MEINPEHAPLAGLNPADLLRQGAAEDTFMDIAPSSFNPLPIEELAVIFPQFDVLELIGKGGMGAVYKVRQKDLDRIVALKILPPGIGRTPEFSNRFTREAKALAKLNHPGIVTLHEFGQQDGLYFILMEFVDGVNLAQLMKTGRISSREALAIVPQICDALQFAHDQGIVHRDIKPENLLLDRHGRVKVADFGIAKVVAAVCEEPIRGGATPVPNDATLAGKVLGTPQYMAPEQIEHPSDVDHRADIYALGVVFYQMLTGELPEKDLQAPSRKVQIDVRLDEIVLRAMEKQPDLRYQTAHEFRTIVDGFQEQAQPPLFPLPKPKRGVLQRWWWVFLVMIPVGLLIGIAVGSMLAYVFPKKYEAETVIEFRPVANLMMTSSLFADQFETITSQDSLIAVANELDLPNQWMLSQDAVIQRLKSIITTQNIRGTNLIAIRVRHSDRQKVAAIAKALALNYQQVAPGEVVIHEDAMEPTIPVSRIVGWVLFRGGFLGLIFSPLLSLIAIAVLRKKFPEKLIANAPLQANGQATAKDQVAGKLKTAGDISSRTNTHLDSFAVTSFVLGLASLIVGPLGSLPAIIFGHIALLRIKSNPWTTGNGYALAGLVLGYITLILIIIVIVVFGYTTSLFTVFPNEWRASLLETSRFHDR